MEVILAGLIYWHNNVAAPMTFAIIFSTVCFLNTIAKAFNDSISTEQGARRQEERKSEEHVDMLLAFGSGLIVGYTWPIFFPCYVMVSICIEHKRDKNTKYVKHLIQHDQMPPMNLDEYREMRRAQKQSDERPKKKQSDDEMSAVRDCQRCNKNKSLLCCDCTESIGEPTGIVKEFGATSNPAHSWKLGYPFAAAPEPLRHKDFCNNPTNPEICPCNIGVD